MNDRPTISSAPTEPGAPITGDLLSPGEVVDRVFEIRRKIAEGGMGEVYEAFDLGLGRRIALKITKRPDGSFDAEARTLAALRHPAIVEIFHRGKYREHEYFAMELIEGGSLETRLMRPEPLSVIYCLDLLDAIADALDYLHRNGLVHRDLKPANVMLAPGDRVILLDFGIVLQERGAAEVDEIAGTLHYVAPETLRGDLEVGDAHLVDLYALGILAFQLLTKQLPFDASTTLDLAHQHLAQVAPRPSTLRPSIPPRLDHLVVALLSKEPDERPASMAAVRGQLNAIRRWMGQAQANPPPAFVLIVDDDPDMLGLLRACVKQTSPTSTVDVASSVADAVIGLRSRTYDLIFLDLKLGDGSGVDILMEKNMLGLSPEARVIMVSSHDQPANRSLASSLGVSTFISKNHGQLELEDAISDQMFRKRRSGETNNPESRRSERSGET